MAHEALLNRDDTVLVVVDFQERLLPAMHEGPAALAAARVLAAGMRELGVPILVAEQYPKGLGPTVPELAEVLAGAPRWPKRTFSAARCEPFLDALEDFGRDQIVVCGIEAHICVLQTALDLVSHGLQVHVAADATASRKAGHRDNAFARMRRESVVVTNVESALFECLGAAEGETFKRLSALVK